MISHRDKLIIKQQDELYITKSQIIGIKDCIADT